MPRGHPGRIKKTKVSETRAKGKLKPRGKPFQKGGPAGPGRPKGSVDRTTRTLKEAILLAAEQAGGEGGLTAYLLGQAQANPTAFLTLLGRVLPHTLSGEADTSGEITIRWQAPQ